MSVLWACPVCREALARAERAYVCPNRHGFDLAGEGYVNLLLANQKRSREPGDDAEMVRARSRFLDRGHYAPLATRLLEAVAELAEGRAAEPLEILDSGCGEGYFLSRLREGLEARGIAASHRGIDISRPAVRAAARRDPRLGLAVASVHHLPVATGSLDLILRVLAPLDAAEFRRALKTDGLLLGVTPGPDHLLALRRLVYESPRLRPSEPTPEGFEVVRSERLTFPLRLASAEDLRNLLGMTPYKWRASAEARARIASLETLETAADFTLSLYAPANPAGGASRQSLPEGQ